MGDRIRDMASARVLEFLRNAPRRADVIVVDPGFCMPRMFMHMCSASRTTITPLGCRVSNKVSAIWEVRRS